MRPHFFEAMMSTARRAIGPSSAHWLVATAFGVSLLVVLSRAPSSATPSGLLRLFGLCCVGVLAVTMVIGRVALRGQEVPVRVTRATAILGAVVWALGPVLSLLGFRVAAEALRARAMRELASDNWEAASRDVLTTHRLAALLARDPNFIAVLVRFAVREHGASVVPVLASRAGTAERESVARLLEELSELPSMTEWQDVFERTKWLSLIQNLRRLAMSRGPGAWIDELEPLDILQRFGYARSPSMKSLYTIDPRAIDWGRALELVNRVHDLHVAILAAEDSRLEKRNVGKARATCRHS